MFLKHIGLNYACMLSSLSAWGVGWGLGLSPLNLILNFVFLIRKSTSEHGQALNGSRVDLNVLHR